jgi:drug/metabolite transporter (DMT)-like permease
VSAVTQRAGLPLGLLAGASFGTSSLWSASLLTAGWSPAAVTFVRLGGAALLLCLPALAAGGRLRLTRRDLPYGAAIGGCYVSYVNALEHMSISLALLLEYSSVLLVVLWTWWRGRRPGTRTVAGGVLCLGGLALALEVTGDLCVDLVGLLWALGSAVGCAAYFVISAHRDAPPLVTAWSGTTVAAAFVLALSLVGSSVGLLPLHAATADITLLHRSLPWFLPVLGMTVVSSALAMTSGIAAAWRLGARLASFVGLSEVLFGIALAWLVLQQSLDVWQCVGGLAVITGIALVHSEEAQADAAPDRGAAAPVAAAVPLPAQA